MKKRITIYKEVDIDINIDDVIDGTDVEYLLNTIKEKYKNEFEEVLKKNFKLMDADVSLLTGHEFDEVMQDFVYKLDSQKYEILKRIVDNSYHLSRG
jgi:hypothetical protein